MFLETKAGRQNILHGMITSVPLLQSALILFLNRILIFHELSKLFEFFNSLRGILSKIFTLTLSFILNPKNDHVLSCNIIHF